MPDNTSYLTPNQGNSSTGAVSVPDGQAVVNLGNLLDVLVPSPTDGQVLTFVASDGKWEAATPTTPPSGGAAISAYTLTGTAVPGDGTITSLTWALVEGPAIFDLTVPTAPVSVIDSIMCFTGIVTPADAESGKIMTLAVNVASLTVGMDVGPDGATPPSVTTAYTTHVAVNDTVGVTIAHNTGSTVDFSGVVVVQPLL